MRESVFQKMVIDLAHLYRWKVAHFRPALMRSGQWATPCQADAAGFPDLLLVKGERLLVAELKVGKNRPTAQQEQWLAAFQGARVQAFVWRPENWDTIEEVLSS